MRAWYPAVPVEMVDNIVDVAALQVAEYVQQYSSGLDGHGTVSSLYARRESTEVVGGALVRNNPATPDFRPCQRRRTPPALHAWFSLGSSLKPPSSCISATPNHQNNAVSSGWPTSPGLILILAAVPSSAATRKRELFVVLAPCQVAASRS